jgi:mannose-1-phosphate guanylyltransferase
MAHSDHHWALVLAAGDGRRLQGLTRTERGTVVPKQFCSLVGGLSFLEETVGRAGAVVPRERICAVVACAHRQHWSRRLDTLPSRNIFAQPRNRGTAIGILLPLLHILERDADARIVLLPSDHHVRNEVQLATSLRGAVSPAVSTSTDVVLLGIEPREPDSELGYIVPRQNGAARYSAVDRFVEKPSRAEAQELIQRGALWNAFIIAADAKALLCLFERRYPEIVRRMHRLIKHERLCQHPSDSLARLYDELPDVDFSRGILQGQEELLCVLAVPECGWSDLGTPQRVADALRELPSSQVTPSPRGHWRATVSLAAQHALLHANQANSVVFERAFQAIPAVLKTQQAALPLPRACDI